MAANLDRAETSLTAVSDVAYIRAIDSSGNSVRISKADLASVLGATYGCSRYSVSIPKKQTVEINISPTSFIIVVEGRYGIIGIVVKVPAELQLVKGQYFDIGSDKTAALVLYGTGTTITLKNNFDEPLSPQIFVFHA